MKIFKIILSLVITALLCLSAILYFGPFQLKNPSYLLWVLSGNECPKEYLDNYVFLDLNNSLIIRGRTETEIKKRFPVLFDADSFPKESNRAKILEELRKAEYQNKNLKMFWFDDQFAWGWAILMVDGKGYKFDMFKQ